MAQLIWNDVGDRYFEAGVDRGVLYIDAQPGVAWNGLVAVRQKVSGGSAVPTYIDGIKVANYAAPEEASFTLSAFYSPREFDLCDGIVELAPGYRIHNQTRKEFGLSYRTGVGNDIEGSDFGYKIHLIYNALASPSDVGYQTMSESLSVQPLTWELSTRPLILNGSPISAHFEFDSTRMSRSNLNIFEKMIYGDDLSEPRMPPMEEVLELHKHAYGVARYGIDTYP